jgi:hypothetical protein
MTPLATRIWTMHYLMRPKSLRRGVGGKILHDQDSNRGLAGREDLGTSPRPCRQPSCPGTRSIHLNLPAGSLWLLSLATIGAPGRTGGRLRIAQYIPISLTASMN